MTRDNFGEYNIVATFAGMEDARAAITALERGGIDGVNVSLLGRTRDEAETAVDERERDGGAVSDVSKSAAKGTAAGGGVGAVAGLLGGLAAFGIPGVGPFVGSAIWAATLGGAGLGAAVGGMVGGVSATNQSESWEATYQQSVASGRVLVGVHSDQRSDIDKARDILTGLNPAAMDEFDANRRPISAA